MAAVAAQEPMATTEQQLTAVAIELGPAVTATAMEQRCMPAMVVVVVVAVAMAIIVVQIAATADLGNAVVASAATAAGMGPASTQDIATIDFENSMAIEKHIAKQSLVVPAQVPAKADHTVPAFATDHCLASSYFI